jgi:hypothetical protein
MKRPEWSGKIFVGGGFLRSIVAGDPINDIDVFVGSEREAEDLGQILADKYECKLWRTDNALTVTGAKPTIQIIHRWLFKTGFEAADSFDFTCCCAMFWWDANPTIELGVELPTGEFGAESKAGWQSYCDERFYCDVAGKRLIYRNPVRNEDAGGSMLRVLKYYQKGYRIPVDSLADVITRLVQGVDFQKLMPSLNDQAGLELGAKSSPGRFSAIICALLREVDPLIDPSHVAHLPAERTGGTPGEGQ